jgi:hypothetical protein
VQIIDAVPGTPPFVVRVSDAWLARQYLPGVAALGTLGPFISLAGAAVLPYSVSAGVIALTVGLTALGGAVAAMAAYRQSKGAGAVALAADTEGVWLALKLTRRPRIAYLPWPEVAAVRVANWPAPDGRHLMFVCFDAPTVVRDALADPVIATRTARARANFGTPFVLSDRGKDTDLFAMLRALTPLARAAGVPVESVLPG